MYFNGISIGPCVIATRVNIPGKGILDSNNLTKDEVNMVKNLYLYGNDRTKYNNQKME